MVCLRLKPLIGFVNPRKVRIFTENQVNRILLGYEFIDPTQKDRFGGLQLVVVLMEKPPLRLQNLVFTTAMILDLLEQLNAGVVKRTAGHLNNVAAVDDDLGVKSTALGTLGDCNYCKFRFLGKTKVQCIELHCTFSIQLDDNPHSSKRCADCDPCIRRAVQSRYCWSSHQWQLHLSKSLSK